MAIARDNFTAATNTTATSLTFSHTCTGGGLILWVGVLVAYGSDANDHLSSVTYNSVAMTRKVGIYTGSSYNRIYLYYLLGPSTGSNNVVVTCDASSFIDASACSYTGAVASTPEDDDSNTSASTTSIIAGVVTTIQNSWTVACARAVANGALSPGASTYLVGGDPYIGFFDSDGPLAAGANSLTAETTPAQAMGIIVSCFAPISIGKIDGISVANFSKINEAAIGGYEQIDEIDINV